jgi:uncharacterized protein (TIGR00255 family)
MIRSMTAFGRADLQTPSGSHSGRWVVEIHSVNKKALDINLSLPKDFLCFDVEIRKWIAEAIHRGQVSVRLMFYPAPSVFEHASLQTFRSLKTTWEHIARELGRDPAKEVTLAFLSEQAARLPSPEVCHGKEDVLASLKTLIDSALNECLHMKTKEGVALKKDIEERLYLIEQCVPSIEAKSAGTVDVYRDKLIARIQDVMGTREAVDERILREIALFAERIDVTEEVVRLKSHLKQFHQMLRSEEKSVGRTLDFIIQEMHREIHTMNAKSADSEISSLTLAMRGELEKIREQVQNIE